LLFSFQAHSIATLVSVLSKPDSLQPCQAMYSSCALLQYVIALVGKYRLGVRVMSRVVVGLEGFLLLQKNI
jgi:hypothetical protein